MHSIKTVSKVFIVVFLTTTTTACMVGPNFFRPIPPPVTHYTAHPLPKQTVSIKGAGKSGTSQHFNYGQDIQDGWWELFHSKEINDLVCTGIYNSPTLDAAKATLWEAQESWNIQFGESMFPQLNGVLTAQRQRFSTSSFGINLPNAGGAGMQTGNSGNGGSVFNLFTASVNVSYTLDVWGGLRRQLESLLAQVHFQEFELIGAYLTLTSNIVSTAINVASLEAQIKATRELANQEEKQLVIVNQQFELGGVSGVDVATQETLVNQTRALIPPLEKQLAIQEHELAILVGDFPDRPIPKLDLEALNLPSDIPMSIPSIFVRQRPDIRAAEALMHAACAQIGVATANLLPQINITGSYGYQSNIASQLFSGNNKVWNIMAQLTQPIFHGGALLAARRQAFAAYKVADAQYRQTVLEAFKNVADSLRAIETDARTLHAQKAAENSALRTLKITQSQYLYGGVSYVSLLVAQQQYQRAKIATIRAQADRYSDTVALFQSLGGGWWNNDLIIYGRDDHG